MDFEKPRKFTEQDLREFCYLGRSVPPAQRIKISCPKCISDRVIPTYIGNGAQCISCGYEFSAWLAATWPNLSRAVSRIFTAEAPRH